MIEELYKIETGNKVRTFGGWYRHDTVRLTADNVVIGRFQYSRKNKRTTCLTLATDDSAVLGIDVLWLLKKNGVELV